jgi:hypothetical protein
MTIAMIVTMTAFAMTMSTIATTILAMIATTTRTPLKEKSTWSRS